MNKALPNHTFIIAEAGVNHNGSLEMAIQLIDVAAEAGADAVKFQTFKADNLVSKMAKKAEYQKKTTDEYESQFDMLKKLELDYVDHIKLIEHCQTKGIHFLSTPFDLESADLLINEFDITQIKIPSGEITNALLLLKVAQSRKPVILSTGMSTLGEIEMALGVLAFGYTCKNLKPSAINFQKAYFSEEGRNALREKVSLLHCTSEYPALFEEVNLYVMDTLNTAFGLPVGFSDHTVGISAPIAAVARGAVIIEKHFTIDKNLPGPDHKASLDPSELKSMVWSIREVERILGSRVKVPTLSEAKNKIIARKSIVALTDIKKGEVFSEKNVTVKRSGEEGLSPMSFWELLGKESPKDYSQDETVKI